MAYVPAADHAAFAHLSDAQLDEQIALLESWLAFDQETIASAVRERESRGRGAYELTPTAEAYILEHSRGHAA